MLLAIDGSDKDITKIPVKVIWNQNYRNSDDWIALFWRFSYDVSNVS